MNPQEFEEALQENLKEGIFEIVNIDGKDHVRLTHKGIIWTQNFLVKKGINPSDMEEIEEWLRRVL